MSKRTTHHLDPHVFAVVHPAGEGWRVLVARIAGGAPTLLEASHHGPAAAGAVEQMLARHHAGRVIGVIPAARVICRTCPLPMAEPEQLEQALSLQAEAHLQGHVPDYRTAMAVLPAAAGETSRSGIVLCWPTNASIDWPFDVHLPGREASFAPDIAGLASLLAGLRPTDPLLWVDRRSGSVAMAVTHANGAVFRCTRSADDGSWASSVTRALAETALGSGHSATFAASLSRALEPTLNAVRPGGTALLLPESVIDAARDRLGPADGLTITEPGWWQTFGVATGVVLAAAGELAPLTWMQEAPEVATPSRWDRIQSSLSRPRAAALTIVGCLLVMALLPLLVSGARLLVLQLRYPDLEAQTKAIARTEERLAMYAALEKQAWSTTKILSDIVTNTPEGIELESVRVQHTDMSFAVSGEARPEGDRSATEVLKVFEDNLYNSRMFGEISLNWGDRNSYGHYQFDLSAKVTAPHWQPNYETARDFAVWTLADRQAGRPAPTGGEKAAVLAASTDDEDPDDVVLEEVDPASAPVAPAAVVVEDDGSEDDPEAVAAADSERPHERTRPGGDLPGGMVRRSVERDGGGEMDPAAIPEALTAEQINAMTIEEVNDHLPKVAEARRRARRAEDPELEARLKREFDMLLARKRKGR